MRKKTINVILILAFSSLSFSCASPYSDESSSIELEYTQGLEYTLNNDGNSYAVSNGENTDQIVNIPPYYNDMPVIEIAMGGFAGLTNIKLKKVIVPETVKTIGHYAFESNEYLQEIVLHEGLEKINVGAFSNLPSLKKLNIPNSVEYFGRSILDNSRGNFSTFYDGAHYIGTNENPFLIYQESIKRFSTSVTIQEGCKFVSYIDFSMCKDLYLPDSLSSIEISFKYEEKEHFEQIYTENIYGNCKLKHIGEGVFSGTRKLVNFPTLEYCKTIGEQSFSFSSISGKINLASIEKIDPSAFYYCKKIQEVTLGENLKKISSRVFEKCLSLETVYIPLSVTSINKDAFKDCSSLRAVRLPSSMNKPDELDEWKWSGNLEDMVKFVGISFAVATTASWALYRLFEITNPVATGLLTIVVASAIYGIENAVVHGTAFTGCNANTVIYTDNTYLLNWTWRNYTTEVLSGEACPKKGYSEYPY